MGKRFFQKYNIKILIQALPVIIHSPHCMIPYPDSFPAYEFLPAKVSIHIQVITIFITEIVGTRL
jgi:hypothetical protein